ncbi:coproporphyrinogen-III oxidase family protein [Leptospirillum ferriphilum]|uniref:Putative radical SAM family enzyme n=2 Tax=Leptospirillum TaxID=179 RepID=A0A094WAR8_9BACT|nr:coproporphyrinogen-III oxidase family protein [Leptospirillum ferriphilum]EDZ39327.1 MAG: Putative oxygen-independent coproporphyrinogen III oxidase [Leptospirillum sp. Group II '5-way CG']KGA92757.1 putative radical SAM family enzyme [Leptospirillum ferriphilum]
MHDALSALQKIRTLYVQVPFCPERCHYCSLPVSLQTERAPAYLRALFREKKRLMEREDLSGLETLYVGGGTPTVLPLPHLQELLEELQKGLPPLAEITVESRPDTVTPEILHRLRSSGVTRLSFGMESVRSEHMRFLGRTMNVLEPVRFLEFVRNHFSGFVSMDFIAGGEGFSEDAFLQEAQSLLAEGLDHLSLYPLTVEEQTSLKGRLRRGEISAGTEDAAGRIWERIVRALSSMGWFRYEVANFSRSPDTVCRHNHLVWQGYDHAGIGAGAHQRIRSVRTINVRSLVSYEERLFSMKAPFEGRESLDQDERLLEILYTNARLSNGFPLSWLSSEDRSNAIGGADFSDLVEEGYLDSRAYSSGRVIFTEKGRDLLDGLMGEIWSRLRS